MRKQQKQRKFFYHDFVSHLWKFWLGLYDMFYKSAAAFNKTAQQQKQEALEKIREGLGAMADAAHSNKDANNQNVEENPRKQQLKLQFQQHFEEILLQLLHLRENPKIRNRGGYPYPKVKDILVDKIDLKSAERCDIFTATNNFLRKYCVTFLGNAGWKNNKIKGHEPVPREKQFCRMWTERKISCFSICEFRTSKVSIYTN
jgi:hypothetical protein